MIIEDRREHAEGIGFVVATDSFLSGRSLYAIQCRTLAEAQTVEDNMRARSEMKRPRWLRCYNDLA